MAGVIDSTVRWARAGELAGQPVFVETGLAEDDSTARAEFALYETGRVTIEPLPRRAGLAVKGAEGQSSITLRSINDAVTVGSVTNLLQLGRTTVEEYAPEQPIGPHEGSRIVRWSRRWVKVV